MNSRSFVEHRKAHFKNMTLGCHVRLICTSGPNTLFLSYNAFQLFVRHIYIYDLFVGRNKNYMLLRRLYEVMLLWGLYEACLILRLIMSWWQCAICARCACIFSVGVIPFSSFTRRPYTIIIIIIISFVGSPYCVIAIYWTT